MPRSQRLNKSRRQSERDVTATIVNEPTAGASTERRDEEATYHDLTDANNPDVLHTPPRVHDPTRPSALAKRRNQRPPLAPITTETTSANDHPHNIHTSEGVEETNTNNHASPQTCTPEDSIPQTLPDQPSPKASQPPPPNQPNRAVPSPQHPKAYHKVLVQLKILTTMTHLRPTTPHETSEEKSNRLEEALDLAMQALDTTSRHDLGEAYLARCCYWIGVAIYHLGKSPPFDRRTYWFEEAGNCPEEWPECAWAEGWIGRIVSEDDDRQQAIRGNGGGGGGAWSPLKSIVGSALSSLWGGGSVSVISSDSAASQPLRRPPRPISQGSDTKKNPRPPASTISIVRDRPNLERIPSFRSFERGSCEIDSFVNARETCGDHETVTLQQDDFLPQSQRYPLVDTGICPSDPCSPTNE